MLQKELITKLREYNQKHHQILNSFSQIPTDALNMKKDEKSWSALECLEHLNLVANHYHDGIRKALDESAEKDVSKLKYKPGLFGGYFSKSMLPKDKMMKIKTFQMVTPSASKLDKEVMERFKKHLEEVDTFLKEGEKVNLNQIKCPILISQKIKLKIADALRLVVFHNHRHLWQAEKNLNFFDASHTPLTH